MKTLRNIILSSFLITLLATPLQAESMSGLVSQAVEIYKRFESQGPKIPAKVLSKAKGVIFMKITKGGLVIAGQHGDGIMLARNKQYGWSGAVAVDTSGASFGLQGGGSVTRMVVLLNTDNAVNQFVNNSDVKFVGEMEGTAGPAAKDVHDNWAPDSSVYVYSSTDGAFGGLSIKGVTFTIDQSVTNTAYGKPVVAGDVLNGKIAPTKVSEPIRNILKKF